MAELRRFATAVVATDRTLSVCNAAPPRKPGVAERLEVYAKVFGLKGV